MAVIWWLKAKTRPHYAICAGFMALMMLPGIWSGALADAIGYVPFFARCCLATILSLVMTALLRIPEGFGERRLHEQRLLSLDATRGLTIAAMLLVNNPGDWGQVYAPLSCTHWHG